VQEIRKLARFCSHGLRPNLAQYNFRIGSKYDLGVDQDNDCANFVSYALKDGGLKPVAGLWEPGDDGAWENVPKLVDFLKSHGFLLYEYFNFPNYSDDGANPPNLDNFVLLRDRPEWTTFLETTNIQKGDVIVYYHQIKSIWIHAAIVVDERKSPPTTFINKNEYSFPEPGICDHSGPLRENDLDKYVRSMGDTKNEYLTKVGVLHAP